MCKIVSGNSNKVDVLKNECGNKINAYSLQALSAYSE
jgi:hypothetical protein